MSFNVQLNYKINEEFIKSNILNKSRIGFNKVLDYTNLSRLFVDNNVYETKGEGATVYKAPDLYFIDSPKGSDSSVTFICGKITDDVIKRMHIIFDFAVEGWGSVYITDINNYSNTESDGLNIRFYPETPSIMINEIINEAGYTLLTDSTTYNSDTFYTIELIIDFKSKTLSYYFQENYKNTVNFTVSLTNPLVFKIREDVSTSRDQRLKIKNLIIFYE